MVHKTFVFFSEGSSDGDGGGGDDDDSGSDDDGDTDDYAGDTLYVPSNEGQIYFRDLASMSAEL